MWMKGLFPLVCEYGWRKRTATIVASCDWDIGAIRQKQKDEAAVDPEKSLSEEERAVTELKAAMMILNERVAAYTQDLTAQQTKLDGLNERALVAEKRYLVRFIAHSLCNNVAKIAHF
jgi:hypothetical protein